ENNKDYVKSCKNGTLRIGKLHHFIEEGKTIINFPTKDKWREKSKIEYIDKGLEEFVKLISELNVYTIAIPPLGCGNGGLNWNEVKRLIEEKLEPIKDDYNFIIYEPSLTYKQVSKVAPKLSVSSLVLMKIRMNSRRFNSLSLQKTAFFTNFFLGEDYFVFDKYKFGPYAHSIDIISRSIREYQDYYNLKSTEETYNMVYKVICSDKTVRTLEKLNPAIMKAVNYVNNINNNKTLEGVSTVLYLLLKNNSSSMEDIVQEFKDWSKDKMNRFSNEEIESYVDYLENTGIIFRNIVGCYDISYYSNQNNFQVN
ncbi:MAG: Appr-1-p processing protein, partial [Clostridiales bacterium]|nr:Appr-1-p processing protein [Clostridiales bacterium]